MSLFTPTALLGHMNGPPNVQALARMSRPLLLQSSKVSLRAEARGQKAGQGRAMHIMVTAKQRQTSKTLAFGALMVVVAQHVVPVGEVAWFVK